MKTLAGLFAGCAIGIIAVALAIALAGEYQFAGILGVTSGGMLLISAALDGIKVRKL
jgi:hypothetical protein